MDVNIPMYTSAMKAYVYVDVCIHVRLCVHGIHRELVDGKKTEQACA